MLNLGILCELYAPSPDERRTRGFVQSCVQEIRGISLVVREMWDTTALSVRLSKPTVNVSLDTLTNSPVP